MKRLLSKTFATAIALTALASTAALAQPYPPGPPPGYYPPPGPGPGHGPGWHRWHRGERFYGNRYVVINWPHYRLRPPPPGYQWVRTGRQFVLIGITSGIVADIIINTQYP
jgi:hypothetical protein